jgi:hypothetical protein
LRRHRGSAHAGCLLQALDHLLERSRHLRRPFPIGAGREREPRGDQAVGIEARIDALQVPGTSDEQARSRQQGQRQRDLAHDEQGPDAVADGTR